MKQEDLETKAKKAVLDIKTKLNRIYSALRDISLKFCHVIEYKLDYFTEPKDIDYKTDYARRKRK